MLSQNLRAVDINPAKQNLAVVDSIWAWTSIVSSGLDGTGEAVHIRALWLGDFFPRFKTTLFEWLSQDSSSTTRASEIEQWYKGWKQHFMANSKKLDNLEATNSNQRKRIRNLEALVEQQFKQCLAMIAASMRSNQHLRQLKPPDALSFSYANCLRQLQDASATARVQLRQTNRPQVGMRSTVGGTVASGGNVTFRDVLERLATQNGLEFVPNFKRGRAHSSGKQIYRFGSANCYIDRDVVFVLNTNGGSKETWEPVSTDKLVELGNQQMQPRSTRVPPTTTGAKNEVSLPSEEPNENDDDDVADID